MISNLRISVAELVVWALLAVAGLTWISLRALDGAAWLMDRLRDRRGDGGHWDDEDSGLCAGCKGFAHCDGADFACNCTCTWPEDWAEQELPPERTWEQMTSHQLPLERVLVGELERQGWFDADVQDRLRVEYEARHTPPVVEASRIIGPEVWVTDAWSQERRERRMPGWEAESRQAYAALDLEYPSGLMARVREAAQ